MVLGLNELVQLLGQLGLLDAAEGGQGEAVLGRGLVVVVLLGSGTAESGGEEGSRQSCSRDLNRCGVCLW